MSTRDCTEASFLHDVRDHKVTIRLDQPPVEGAAAGYRHLRCQRPGSWCMGFDIVTYPGYLVMSGDMGSWVFTRLPDMLKFFREAGHERKGETLHINLSYWAEKLEAVDKSDGLMEFDPDLFEQRVREHVAEWLAEQQPDEDDADGSGTPMPSVELPEDLAEAIDDLIARGSEDGDAAHEALRNFDDERIRFVDTWEWNFDAYTYRFVWACYAIAWAIREYDKARSGEGA